MNMRDLTDEERVLLAEFRMCEEQTQEKICNVLHMRAADAKTAAEMSASSNTHADGSAVGDGTL